MYLHEWQLASGQIWHCHLRQWALLMWIPVCEMKVVGCEMVMAPKDAALTNDALTKHPDSL